MSIDIQKQQEKVSHNHTYKALAATHLTANFTAEGFLRETATPSYEDNSSPYGDIGHLFQNKVMQTLQKYSPQTVHILDYGCGMGKLSVYLAMQGYEQVYGFDLSEEGVAFGAALAELNGVGDRVQLRQMDAEKLDYPDEFFDVVIGKAVLHHTIKYPKSADELHRVLKPGGYVLFRENIGNNPLLKIARFFTMKIFGRHGDVNITTSMLRTYARNFSALEIEAWHFFYMGKRFLWRPGPQARWRKVALRGLKQLDDATIHKLPPSVREQFCGDSIFILRK